MRQLASLVVATLAAGLFGAGLDRLRRNPVVVSAAASIGGWVIGSLVAAAGWLLWPPDGIDVLAVSVGAHEALLSSAVIVVLGLLIHYGITMLAGATSRLLDYRATVVSVIGAVVGVISFAAGWAVRGMR